MENTVPPKDETFSMAISDRVYSSKEESESVRNTRGYMFCTMWSGRGINQPYVF